MQALKESSEPQLFAVPFVCWISHTSELSDNAIYNDQAAICDVKGDRFITLQEAANYRARVDEKVALAQAKAAKADGNEPKPAGPAAVTQKDADPPPALIHFSSRSNGEPSTSSTKFLPLDVVPPLQTGGFSHRHTFPECRTSSISRFSKESSETIAMRVIMSDVANGR